MPWPKVAVVLACLYVAVVLVLTLARPAEVLSDGVRSTGADAAEEVPVPRQVRDRVNVPGREALSERSQRQDAGINFVLLVPLGALLPIATSKRSVVLLVPLGLSAVIEVLQGTVFTYRFAQPSDVVLNTLGAWMASGAVMLASSLWRRVIR